MTVGSNAALCLSDNETKVDLLNNEAIAKTIITLLLERPNHPVTIGVHGDWGAGKSSVLEMIESGLDEYDGILCLKFNGWRFQGFEDAKIALLEGIVTGLLEKRPALTKATDEVKEVFRRIDWLKVAKRVGGLAFTAFTGIPTPDQLETLLTTIGGVFSDPTKLVNKENIGMAFGEAQALLKPKTESKNVPEEIGEFRKAFDKLLEKAEIKQLIVLIDDLDRCLPETAIETLEAVRLFVFTSHTAFVVAADEAMIEYAVRKHFPDLPNTTGPQSYARKYLEKLIQVPFRIPALGIAETRIYVTLLLIGAEIGEDDPDFIKLIAKARELLKRPWIGHTLDAATIEGIFKAERNTRAQNALILSDQIGPILANGTNGNPRQIKRFLNTLVLRQRTAFARGFGEEIKIPVLAKLMLAERFFSSMFDQIANAAVASPNGHCDNLAPLEVAAAAKDKSASLPHASSTAEGNVSKTEASSQSSMVIQEWLSTPTILAWASVKPSLASEDLRPYLFVTKDRKDYFGPASVLGNLATIAEKLLGPKLAVQAQESELKQLAESEATQIFETLRSQIMGSDSFATEPPGIPGLQVLVKVHPSLQSNLLSLLESLPIEHLGVWVVAGWTGVITVPEQQVRLNHVLRSWTGDSADPFLKAAALSVLEMPKGGR